MAILAPEVIAAIVNGEHADPFAVLGPHQVDAGGRPAIAVRAFVPDAAEVRLAPARPDRGPVVMERLDRAGLFEAVVDGVDGDFRYRLEVVAPDGAAQRLEDPYRFPPLLSDLDRHLLGEGRHEVAHECLGAHVRTVDGVIGVGFAVWAPNARRVSVVGDFNAWDRRRHPMRLHPGLGVWELFLPGVGESAHYKYDVRPRSGEPMPLKSDPYALAFEEPPRTASVVTSLDGFPWGDAEWLAARSRRDQLAGPMAVYEVHLGSWRRVPEQGDRPLTYRELAETLPAYVRDLGYTHVELLPVTEHPFYGSWGYQPIGMFAPTRRYGGPRDFMALVDACHRAGLGVILDWVPAHFPGDAHGLARFDGTHLYEHADPRQGSHPDWGTLVYNYGRNEVANFLLASGLSWLDRYHVDGLRVDAVASMLYLDYSRKPGEWIPNRYGGRENLEAVAFLRRFNEVVYGRHPGVLTVAEESTAWPMVSRPTWLGGLGFGYKWNMGWMHDVLHYMSLDPVHRKHHHDRLTFGLVYAWQENFVLPLSHDEVVHGKGSLLGKMPGDDWHRFANLRALYAFMYGHPGKKLLFMGGEFGQVREWSHDRSLDWHLLDQGPYHRGLQHLVRDLNRLYRGERALHEVDFAPAGFEWMDCNNWEQSVVAFVRRAADPDDLVLIVCNFTPVPRFGYRIGVPAAGAYGERLNTDAACYGGSNLGNAGGAASQAIPWHGQPHSIVLTLPPLAVLVLVPEARAGARPPA